MNSSDGVDAVVTAIISGSTGIQQSGSGWQSHVFVGPGGISSSLRGSTPATSGFIATSSFSSLKRS